ncbi:hypothetical protein V9T40_010466 [Parthenolecanium corni]|uniref:Uncharacterized protein n=1 Tax=Parthenolecanium corni TaxID=536013 RepID=A0AAN9Y088_9HEMI
MTGRKGAPRWRQNVVALRNLNRKGNLFDLRLDSLSSDSLLTSVVSPKSTNPLSGRESGMPTGFRASNHRATFEFGLS